MSKDWSRERPTYGAVPRCLWDDERFKALTTVAQFLLLWMRTSPDAEGLSGVFRWRPAEAALALKQRTRKILQAADELQRAGFIVLDGPHVFVVDAFAWSPNASLSNPKHVKAVQRALANASEPIRRAFVSRYSDPDPPLAGRGGEAEAHSKAHPDGEPNHVDVDGYGDVDGNETSALKEQVEEETESERSVRYVREARDKRLAQERANRAADELRAMKEREGRGRLVEADPGRLAELQRQAKALRH